MSLSIPTALEPLLAKPIAVFGGGVSGEGVCALASALGARAKVYDAQGVEFTAQSALEHRLVVFSPGFVPDHPWLQFARAAGLACRGELDFASLFWRGQIVAITGTNGKTTLTEFLTHALRSVGRDAHATGNIGHPFSGLVAELGGGADATVAVCEVSSFQAETLEHFRADSTLWTNFAEDHLERHAGLQAYFSAKWRLAECTGAPVPRAARTSPRAVFVGLSVGWFAAQLGYTAADATIVDTEGQAPDALLTGTVFAEYPQRENFVLASAWWRANGFVPSDLYAAARTFSLGRHRLTRVGDVRGVTYWNDSKATNFHAVEAALTRFTEPVVLIAGGKPKGGDLAGFVQRIAPLVHCVVLIGATSRELAAHCTAFKVRHTDCTSLSQAIDVAATIAPAGGHVLLSPGFASFDQFRNYEDRGEQFESLVHKLASESRDDHLAPAPSLR